MVEKREADFNTSHNLSAESQHKHKVAMRCALESVRAT